FAGAHPPFNTKAFAPAQIQPRRAWHYHTRSKTVTHESPVYFSNRGKRNVAKQQTVKATENVRSVPVHRPPTDRSYQVRRMGRFEAEHIRRRVGGRQVIRDDA